MRSGIAGGKCRPSSANDSVNACWSRASASGPASSMASGVVMFEINIWVEKTRPCTSGATLACQMAWLEPLMTGMKKETKKAPTLQARGAEPRRLMAELLGRTTGYAGGRGGSQHVAGRDLRNPVALLDVVRLSSFAGTWAAEKNDTHGYCSLGGVV